MWYNANTTVTIHTREKNPGWYRELFMDEKAGAGRRGKRIARIHTHLQATALLQQ
jgi:hypothetical protein